MTETVFGLSNQHSPQKGTSMSTNGPEACSIPQHRVSKGGGDTGRQASLPGQVEEAVGKRQARSLEMS